jgi:hypothetical protein
MIISVHKVKAARKVLKAIQKMIRKMPKGKNNLFLEHYQNCREQGFIVVNYPISNALSNRWVAFSEYRNSDSIVVYSSPIYHWNCSPNQGMTDEAWRNRVFFGPDEADKAAKFCLKHLLV